MKLKSPIYWIWLSCAFFLLRCDDGSGAPAVEDTPELCQDNEDNDGDGAVDCDDEDCAALPVCEVPDEWIPSWVSAQQLIDMPDQKPPEPGLAGNTLRQLIRLTLGGSEIRVTFSNGAGSTPLEIAAATVAVSLGDGIVDEESLVPLTFSGETSVTIDGTTLVTSDPVEMAVSPLADLAVTVHFGDSLPEQITGHPGSRTTSYLAVGDTVDDADMSDAVTMERWYHLSEVDVMTTGRARSLVILGDSITDGYGSTTDGNDRWPNILSQRLLDNAATENIAVLNQGIGGNCVTRKCIGPSAKDRFKRDVLEPAGVEWVIILSGINDLGNDVPGQNVIDALTEMSKQAHDEGITVIGGAIMPCDGHGYYDDVLETDRQKINDWIRSSDSFDAVIDFDEITRDPSSPTRLSSDVDSGDHLHPSVAGYKLMADAVDLSLFE